MSSLLLFVGASGAASAAEKGGFWLPPAASVTAKGVDLTWWVINYTNLVFFILLMGAMIYFAIAHRQKVEGEKTHPTKGSHALELAWAVVPSFGLLIFFALGFRHWIDQAVHLPEWHGVPHPQGPRRSRRAPDHELRRRAA
jgi:heme/copper-type cytochrome/quinol oxidase subunit 2